MDRQDTVGGRTPSCPRCAKSRNLAAPLRDSGMVAWKRGRKATLLRCSRCPYERWSVKREGAAAVAA